MKTISAGEWQEKFSHLTWCRPGGEDDLGAALLEFQYEFPGWWWSVGTCSVSADAIIGPERTGPDAHLLDIREFDEGFDGSLLQPATVAQALRTAIAMARDAKARHA